ncbi:hypothetical protein [Fructilactobacillus fructivorans]|uniref:DnaD domain-containing protein n=1 Tax=Fructilactobacillus fructivorans TaxID=1614 RepID=A0AAE6P0B5_9LACO|nr:hypothetical protein [Fructilactobacillus fructivorans]KRK58477.1 DnaD domain-containing protein [Fructilactobacillus fructivorans]KRN13318.1 DnaD domain-containing protein [Fructilactobacillus fructivorans]KRN40027.1 DnaD domain-containing protein [Fructilactobacillus fructivorans]KRN42321.1 DnaD domain-containing protein [Fructilactobacillus fructivorans]QFX92485.1 hypothetical protein LF543_02470 [Fructilactobacillus fructivorans]
MTMKSNDEQRFSDAMDRFNNYQLKSKQMNVGEIILYQVLLLNNYKNEWMEWFTLKIKIIQKSTRLSFTEIIKSRDKLKKLGLIDFEKSDTQPTKYKIIKLNQDNEN